MEDFLRGLNSVHKNVKFMCEWEENGRLNFLDVTLVRRGKKITLMLHKNSTE